MGVGLAMVLVAGDGLEMACGVAGSAPGAERFIHPGHVFGALHDLHVGPGEGQHRKAVLGRAVADRADERPPVRPEEREHPAAGDQVEAREHPQHQELALGEVDDAHDAEDEAEADAHQAVDGADGDTGGDRVQDVLDQDFQVHRASLASRVGRPGEVAPRRLRSLPNATPRC